MKIPESLPTKLNIETTNAKLLLDIMPASLDIDVERHGYQIKTHPLELHIDNEDFFDSIGLKSYRTLTEEYAQAGKQAALKSAARYSEEAKLLSKGGTLTDLAYMRTETSIETMLVFIPEERPKIYWTEPSVDIHYEMDEFTYNWNTGGVEGRYIPYSVEISAEE